MIFCVREDRDNVRNAKKVFAAPLPAPYTGKLCSLKIIGQHQVGRCRAKTFVHFGTRTCIGVKTGYI